MFIGYYVMFQYMYAYCVISTQDQCIYLFKHLTFPYSENLYKVLPAGIFKREKYPLYYHYLYSAFCIGIPDRTYLEMNDNFVPVNQSFHHPSNST